MHKKFSSRNITGFTLLEVLIATAVTLLLMIGLSQIFKALGDSITKGRAGLELNNRLRNVIHRVRTDLENVTVTPVPPVKVGSGQGYIKYYDGPCTDFTFSSIDPATGTIDVTKFNSLLSRFGDVDDVFMATVKAEDAWFHGKVPRFVLEGRTGATADLNGNGITDDLSDLVTISSQYAEVVLFVEPMVSNQNNTSRNPAFLALNPTANFEDVFSGINNSASDGIPDGFRLHYRVLLIRPDLNLVNGQLPNFLSTTPNNPLTRAMVAGEESMAPYNAATLPTPTCDMTRIHQYCDLSIRRINDFDPNTVDPVAANSLEDLANPANRFAHVQYEVPGSSNNLYCLPVLALGPSVAAIQGSNPNVAGTGFLHPAFTLMGNRTGEDLLATDVLAFDIKAFDPSAPLIGYVGADGVAGSNGLGSNGSDDVILRPSDPGYFNYGAANISSGNAAIVSYGDFVDLDWNGKGLRALPAAPPYVGPLMTSVFSGTNRSSSSSITQIKQLSLFKSGLVRFETSASGSTLSIFQPSYDSYTDSYEYDGMYQAQLAGSGAVLSRSGWLATAIDPWRTSVDAGSDGVDNETPGDGIADDVDEKETSPPFVTDLRGLQISIRLEDKATKQFKQMSTVKEFVTH